MGSLNLQWHIDVRTQPVLRITGPIGEGRQPRRQRIVAVGNSVGARTSLFAQRPLSIFALVTSICLLVPLSRPLFGQTKRVPDASDPQLIQNVERERDERNSGVNRRIRGSVLLPNGTASLSVVELVAACPGFKRLLALVDSRGRFSFSFESNRQSNQDLEGPGCVAYASLEGYRSVPISLARLSDLSVSNLGTIRLQSISTSSSGVISQSDQQAMDGQKKAYAQALDRASRQDYVAALKLLDRLLSICASCSTAWLAAGIFYELEQNQGEAYKAYLAAAHADPTLAAPLIHAASLDLANGDMSKAHEHSQRAISLNPDAFPHAYAINALANVYLRNGDDAERSAQAGHALDTGRRYPELEYSLGIALLWRHSYAAASEHLREYLVSSTDTRDQAAMGRQLSQLREAQQAVDRLSASASTSEVGPQTDRSNNEFTSESFREHNRPLLETISTYTCMETICPLTREPGSSTLITETFRVDVALSGGSEIYGAAGDTRFSSKSEGEILGSFRTTGLFNTVAKSLMFADQVTIEPAGVVKVNDVTLLRFNFSSLKQHSGWSITYGNQTGSAAKRGWFLVDRKTQLLRRVFVAAVDIPGKLGLISLNALIDYDVSTIAGHRALLPVSAKVDIGESSGRRLTSFMSFTHCRAFATESELHFEQLSYDRESAISEVHPGSLPADLDVVVSLTSPLTLAAPTNSDVLIGRVVKPVTSRGRVLIEAGSGVEGHVRRKTGESALVIELDRVHGKNGWVPFYASLRELGVAKDIHIRSAAQDYEYLVAHEADVCAALPDIDTPGIAMLVFETIGAEIPASAEMVWKTRPLLPHARVNSGSYSLR